MVKTFSLLLISLLLISGCGTQQGADKQESKETPPATSTDAAMSGDETETVATDNVETDQKSEDSNTEVVDDGSTSNPAEKKSEPDPKNSPPARDDGNGRFKEPDTSKEAKNEMIPSITYQQDNRKSLFTFSVKNNLDQLFTYHFDTSQQFDYEIKDSDGKIVQSYEKGKKSPDVPSKYPVKPGGTAIFEVAVEGLLPGSYFITFVLPAKEMQPKASLKFEVK